MKTNEEMAAEEWHEDNKECIEEGMSPCWCCCWVCQHSNPMYRIVLAQWKAEHDDRTANGQTG